jgi:Periplasmic binding protein domain
MMRVHRTRGVGAALSIVLALSVGACGSDDGDSGADASAAQSSASGPVRAAKATVAKFSADQPAIEVPPLSRPVPAGKRLALMGCPLPVCKAETDGATAGAKALGWKVTLYTTPLTPEGYLQTWKRMLDAKPDLIAYLGLLPRDAIKAQLAQADAAKIPTVVYAANGYGASDAAPQASFSTTPTFRTDGKLMGATVVADAGEGPKAVYVNDPTLDYWTQAGNAFTAEVEKAGGSVEQLKVASAGIGKTIPSAIVSYLQRNPDVEYVALALNDFAVGLPGALSGAGLAGKVKVISRAPSAANMTDIAAGRQWAAVADENVAAGWRLTDALARLAIGEDISRCCKEPDGWHQIFTKENAEANVAPKTPGVPDAFLNAWKADG